MNSRYISNNLLKIKLKPFDDLMKNAELCESMIKKRLWKYRYMPAFLLSTLFLILVAACVKGILEDRRTLAPMGYFSCSMLAGLTAFCCFAVFEYFFELKSFNLDDFSVIEKEFLLKTMQELNIGTDEMSSYDYSFYNKGFGKLLATLKEKEAPFKRPRAIYSFFNKKSPAFEDILPTVLDYLENDFPLPRKNTQA